MGGTRLMEYLRYIYGLLEGRTVYYTVHPTDHKLLKIGIGRLPQIALNCRKIAYVTV